MMTWSSRLKFLPVAVARVALIMASRAACALSTREFGLVLRVGFVPCI